MAKEYNCKDKAIIEFLKINDVDFESFDARIFTTKDINPIFANYGIESCTYYGYVNIKDLVGVHNHEFKCGYPEIFDEYFSTSPYASHYLSRSAGMLKLTAENALNNLDPSFSEDLIDVIKIEDKYFIRRNGLHRFLILRLLYLNAVSKLKNPTTEDLEQIKAKFTIPCKVTDMDLVKTYCYFMIDTFQQYNVMNSENINRSMSRTLNNERLHKVSYIKDDIEHVVEVDDANYNVLQTHVHSIFNHYDNDGDLTAHGEVSYMGQMKPEIISDERLIKLTHDIVSTSKKKDKLIHDPLCKDNICDYYNSIPTFKWFIDAYFEDLAREIKMECFNNESSRR